MFGVINEVPEERQLSENSILGINADVWEARSILHTGPSVMAI